MLSTDEIWKPIPGYEGCYEASNLGRIRSLERLARPSPNRSNFTVPGKVLKPGITRSTGYLSVVLRFDGESKMRTVHSLVCEAFIAPRTGGRYVDHINGDRTDNRLKNLRYLSQSQNMLNITKPVRSKVGARGVYKNGSGYNAQIKHNGKALCLGTFRTVEMASKAVERMRDHLLTLKP